MQRQHCRRLLSVACVCALLSLPIAVVQAASLYDPHIVYRTVSSPRFAVHYPEGAYNLAVRISRMAEDVLQKDAALLGFMPKGTIDIVLTDMQDDANGSAEVIPHDVIRLQMAAPTELTGLASYDDWLRILLTHEISHIVDIDHTGRVARALRAVFGKIISFNGSVPQWFSEGVAVWTETKLTPTGRGRSSYVDMVLRMAALERTFVKLDQAHILFARFPFGNAAYFYGGRFHLYLSQRLGDTAVAQLHEYYANQPIPWVYGFGARAIFGSSLESLWRDFCTHETLQARETAEAVVRRGVTESTELFSHGGDLLGARFSRDGNAVLYSRQSPDDGSTTRWFSLSAQANRAGQDKRLFRDTASPRFSLDPCHNNDFVYSMASITHRFDTYNDLYVYDSKRQQRIRLFDQATPQKSLRARDPTIAPDGRRLVFVQNHLQQSWLSMATLSRDKRGAIAPGLHIRPLIGPSGEMQQASPVFSPDGHTLAVSTWFPGGKRDIVLIDAERGTLLRRLTYDVAQDGNPAFSPDGRFVLYESDSDGISNLYAHELATGNYFRITNVIGGAFQADVSPDGNRLLFRQAKGGGFAVHEMPFAPEHWQPVGYDPNTGYSPQPQAAEAMVAERLRAPLETTLAAGPLADAGLAAAEQPWMREPFPKPQARAQEPILALQAHEREGPYRPLRGLVPWGDNWVLIPGAYWVNNVLGASLQTLASDSLRRHTWSLTVGGQMYVSRPNINLIYINDVLLPTFTGSAGFNSTLYAATTGRVTENSSSLGVGAAWPWGRRHQVSIGYNYEHRTIVHGENLNLPSGDFASVAASYRYGFARAFANSISNEAGKAIGIGTQIYNRHAFGGQHDQVIFSVDARGFLNNPLVANHVLALRLAGTWAFGKSPAQKFFLYGTQANSFFTSQSSRLFALRGFLPGVGVGAPTPGAGVAVLYAEYRFPIWHIQRGIFTWPIYFEHLHVALFSDVGNTVGATRSARGAASPDATFRTMLQHLWLSSGVEARLDLSLAWAVPLTVRLGVAQPMLARGRRIVDKVTPHFYINVGTMY